MKSGIALAVSAQGYGSEAAFDYRANMTGHIVIKPYNGREFLNMLSILCHDQGPISVIKVFSHSYPRGIIMSNWSGFYDEPGPDDTKKAAYIKDLTELIKMGKISFMPESQILLYGCNLAGNFSAALSASTEGIVIASAGGTYPQIIGNRETGIFISTFEWKVYKNGTYAYSAGKILRGW